MKPTDTSEKGLEAIIPPPLWKRPDMFRVIHRTTTGNALSLWPSIKTS